MNTATSSTVISISSHLQQYSCTMARPSAYLQVAQVYLQVAKCKHWAYWAHALFMTTTTKPYTIVLQKTLMTNSFGSKTLGQCLILIARIATNTWFICKAPLRKLETQNVAPPKKQDTENRMLSQGKKKKKKKKSHHLKLECLSNQDTLCTGLRDLIVSLPLALIEVMMSCNGGTRRQNAKCH